MVLPSTRGPSLTAVLEYSVHCRATARCLQLLHLLLRLSWGPSQYHIGWHMVGQSVSDNQVAGGSNNSKN